MPLPLIYPPETTLRPFTAFPEDYPAIILADKPQVYVRLRERMTGGDMQVHDSSGNGRHGSYTSATTPPRGFADANGLICAKHAGTATQGISTGWTPPSGDALTFECWINTTDTGQYRDIMETRSNTQGMSLYKGPTFPCGASPGNGRLAMLAAAAHFATGAYGTKTISDGLWHHIAGTWDGRGAANVASSQFQIYIDGLPETMTGFAVGSRAIPYSHGGPVRILNRQATSLWNPCAGKVCEAAAYNKVLTRDRIIAHAMAGFNWIIRSSPGRSGGAHYAAVLRQLERAG